MPKSRTARVTTEHLSPLQRVRDAADAMYRAACECCHQHDRVAKVHANSRITEEIAAAQEACEHCDETLGMLASVYEQIGGNFKPGTEDEAWWRRANALWLAAKEYFRRNRSSEDVSSEFKDHGSDALDAMHLEFELEASALLALRHAADAYRKERPALA